MFLQKKLENKKKYITFATKKEKEKLFSHVNTLKYPPSPVKVAGDYCIATSVLPILIFLRGEKVGDGRIR